MVVHEHHRKVQQDLRQTQTDQKVFDREITHDGSSEKSKHQHAHRGDRQKLADVLIIVVNPETLAC